ACSQGRDLPRREIGDRFRSNFHWTDRRWGLNRFGAWLDMLSFGRRERGPWRWRRRDRRGGQRRGQRHLLGWGGFRWWGLQRRGRCCRCNSRFGLRRCRSPLRGQYLNLAVDVGGESSRLWSGRSDYTTSLGALFHQMENGFRLFGFKAAQLVFYIHAGL